MNSDIVIREVEVKENNPYEEGEIRGKQENEIDDKHEYIIGNGNRISCYNNSELSTVDQRHQHLENVRWRARFTLGLLMFLGLMLAFLPRYILSITIVAMVGKPPTTNTSLHNISYVCPDTHSQDNNTTNQKEGDFAWTVETQGLILGAFFWGYTATTFIGGRAAEYFGGKLVFGFSVVVPSALSLLSPICASVSTELFITLRVIMGLAQGPLIPSLQTMWTAWIPPADRAAFCSVVSAGTTVGIVISMAAGGWLCDTQFLGGWPSAFYLAGIVGVLWGLPWFLLAHNLPEQHPNIHPTELHYILNHRTYVAKQKTASLPIRAIFTSVPYWSIVWANFAFNYAMSTFLTELPTYFGKIQQYDIKSDGLISALPIVIEVVMMVGWGVVVSFLSSRNFISLAVARKLSTAISLYGSATALVVMMWVGCNSTLALVVMCVAVGILGFISSGSGISEQDIAPNLAGSLKGITNTFSSTTGFIAPAITGLIINKNQTLGGWRVVFGLSAVLGVVCCTQFLIFSTVEVQPWNTTMDETHEENPDVQTTDEVNTTPKKAPN